MAPVKTSRRRFGRRTLIVVGVLVLAGVVGVALAFSMRGSAKFHVRFKDMAGLQSGPPPWNNGTAGLPGKLTAVHLDDLAQEALAFHIHVHLDTYYHGKHVALPSGIGIEPGAFITELHTHTSDGVIHVEAPKQRDYQLGQLFGEWGVRLNARCLASSCGHLAWWVNGTREQGNPAELVLQPHQEIVIVAGKRPATIPGSYTFPAGE